MDKVQAQGRPRPHHRMIDRVAAILDAVGRNADGVTLTELSRLLNAPLSSTQGLVNGLVATGYLDELNRRYTLGPAPYVLTRIAGAAPADVVRHEDLQEIHERTTMTVVLAIVVGHDLLYVDYASSSPTFAYLAENFVRRSLIHASSGWILLAGMDRRDLWSRLAALPEEEQPLVQRFLSELPAIQREGLVVTPGVSVENIDGISTAVAPGGRTVAAVGVIGTPDEVLADKWSIIEVLRDVRTRWSPPT